MFYNYKEAQEIKKQHEDLIGKTLKPEMSPLLAILIVPKTDEFERIWNNQPMWFESDYLKHSMSDEEFKTQIKDLDALKIDEYANVYILCVFRNINGYPRFEPLQLVKKYNDL